MFFLKLFLQVYIQRKTLKITKIQLPTQKFILQGLFRTQKKHVFNFLHHYLLKIIVTKYNCYI